MVCENHAAVYPAWSVVAKLTLRLQTTARRRHPQERMRASAFRAATPPRRHAAHARRSATPLTPAAAPHTFACNKNAFPLGKGKARNVDKRWGRRQAVRSVLPAACCVFDTPRLVLQQHVVVFSSQMRKIFPFGAPRKAFADRTAPLETKRTHKSPGRASQAPRGRRLVTLQPTPNSNILHICSRFPTR